MMSPWTKFVDWLKQSQYDSSDDDEANEPLISADGSNLSPNTSAHDVTIVCMRLKFQIEEVIPCELPEERITAAHSNVITPAVVATAKAAGRLGSNDHSACVVFALLIVKNWFKRQAKLELWDADLHHVRAEACEVVAKKIIEGNEDHDYMMKEVLLKRFSIIIDGKPTASSNVIEKAVDLHAVRVIGSSGYQRCIAWLLRGWMCPADGDPDRFVEYEKKTSPHFLDHFDPGRMRVPLYQTGVQIFNSLVYLILYTIAINTINPDGTLDGIEILMYLFTLGFIFDELVKFYKVGIKYIAFWNVFHTTLYSLLTVSFVIRIISLQYEPYSQDREVYSQLSYNFLAFTAPFFWMRLLLFLDGFQFFGTMLVVIKTMMKESAIFFALLSLVLIGFLQAFIGLDMNDDSQTATSFILQQMTNGILGSPDFDGWDRFAPPFGLTLFYMYNFIIIVVLLNVLIALYNSAYSDVTENALDEYMALFSHKVVQAQRAPDENVYIAPFNLIETFVISLPFEWWMSKDQYRRLNEYVMGVIYAPALLVTAFLETRAARQVVWNRRHHQEDEDTTEEWEQMLDQFNIKDDGWGKKVKETSPNVAEDATLVEVRALRQEIKELHEALKHQVERGPDGKHD